MSDAAVSLKKLARNRRFEELESALLEAIDGDQITREDLLAILNLASHRGESEELDSLFWLALTTFAEKVGPEEGLATARDAAPLNPNAMAVREDLVALLAASHPDFPGAGALARRLFLEAKLPLPEAFAAADHLLALTPGTCVLPRNAKVPARVRGLTADGAGLVLETPEGDRTVDLEAAAKLAPLAADDYRAIAAFEPERFGAFATENPSALVETILRLHGPRLPYREFRALLVDQLPMPWAEWWNAARPQIRRSAWIDMTQSNQPTLELRRTPLSHDQEIRDELAAAPSGLARVAIVLDFLDESGEHAAAERELLGHFAEVLLELARGDDAPAALAGMAALGEIAELVPEVVPEAELPPLPGASPADLLAPLASARLEDSALDLVRKRLPDGWADFYAAALPVLTPDGADRVASELEEAGRDEAVLAAAQTVMASPRRYPGALVWLWKYAGSGRLPEAEGGPERGELFAHVLSAMDRASRGPEGRGALYSLYQSAFSTGSWSVSRRNLEATDLAGAHKVREVLERAHGLTEQFRVKIQDLLAEIHPKVYVKEVPPWAREDVIYTTPAGLEKKQAEYSHMVHVRLPEIAAAIGRAASFGDLSENAEYTAALEDRERMTERANSLKADLDRAQILTPDMIPADHVAVGSRVRAKDVDTGTVRTLTFLGPWDVDVAAGIYSYRAPLSLSFMGRAVGDVVTVPVDRSEQTLEIVEIASGLA